MTEKNQNEKEQEEKEEQRQRAFQNWLNCQNRCLKSMEIESNIGLTGLKLLFLLNGSALISLLTFMGHKDKASYGDLSCSMILFFVGLILTGAAFFPAFKWQNKVTGYYNELSKSIDEPRPELKRCGLYGVCILCGTALLMFALGGGLAIVALKGAS